MPKADEVSGRWICLFTQPRNEKLAMMSLKDAGFDAYLPQYKTFITHVRQRRADIRQLFSRYIFAHIQVDTALIWSAYRLKCVSGYARKSLDNSFVQENATNIIPSCENDAGLVFMDVSELQVGRTVKFSRRLLAGLKAIFCKPDDCRRSWIFVEFFGKPRRKRIENRDHGLVACG